MLFSKFPVFFTLCSCWAASAAAAPQDLDVAVIGADQQVVRDDVQQRLAATGRFASVDQFDVMLQLPTLADLQQYDAVLTWSNQFYPDPEGLGDVLADYVDAGGGVVVMVFANAGLWQSLPLYPGGRWEREGYPVISPYESYITGRNTLGTVHDPQHPLVAGLHDFDGGDASFRSMTGNLSPAGQRVADWHDGQILIAKDESRPGKRADLNFYPASSAVHPDYWNESTQGDLIMANALEWTGARIKLSLGLTQPGFLDIRLSGLEPGAPTITLLSTHGAGPSATPWGTLEVSQPWLRTPPLAADAAGRLDFMTTLPSSAAGRTIYAQAVAPEAGAPATSTAAQVEVP